MAGSSTARSAVAALLAFAWGAAPALAQPPAGKAPAAKRAPAQHAAPPAHLWWNDAEIVAALALTPEQRAKMDQSFQKHPQSAAPGAPGVASQGRTAYFSALRAGDLDAARKQLSIWAEEQGKELRETGEMRIEVLSVLSAEQRQRVGKMGPEIVGAPWMVRASWLPQPPPGPPSGAKGPQAKPGPAPAPPAAKPAVEPHPPAPR